MTSVGEMTSLVEVHVSMPDEDSAKSLGAEVVGRRLAACAQVLGPMTSIYTWQGETEQSTEWLLLAKTTAAAFEAFSEAVVAGHPYDTPEVIAVPVSHALGSYDEWVRDAVTAAEARREA